MHIVEEKPAALGPVGNSSVNSLATAAVIVREMLRQADSSLDQIQPVSKADAEISSLPSSCYLS